MTEFFEHHNLRTNSRHKTHGYCRAKKRRIATNCKHRCIISPRARRQQRSSGRRHRAHASSGRHDDFTHLCRASTRRKSRVESTGAQQQSSTAQSSWRRRLQSRARNKERRRAASRRAAHAIDLLPSSPLSKNCQPMRVGRRCSVAARKLIR